jgi:hypothetical protein
MEAIKKPASFDAGNVLLLYRLFIKKPLFLV